MNTDTQPCVICDLSSLVHQMPMHMAKLSNSSGVPTGHTFSFLRSLPKAIEALKPSVLIFTLDAGHSNRDKVYPAYKANRKGKSSGTRVADVFPIINAIPCIILRKEGYEADDLSYTAMLALRQSKIFSNVIILSRDYDMSYTLCHYPKVKHFMTYASETTPTSLYLRFGVLPNRLPLFKAIFGDKSDNIQGLKLGKNKAIMMKKLGDVKASYSDILDLLTEEQLNTVHTNLKVVALQKLSDFSITLGKPAIKSLDAYLAALDIRTIDANAFVSTFPMDIPKMKETIRLLKRISK